MRWVLLATLISVAFAANNNPKANPAPKKVPSNVETKTVCKKQVGKTVETLTDAQALPYQTIVKNNIVQHGAAKPTPGKIYNDLENKFKGKWVVIMGQGSYYRLPPFQVHCIVMLRKTATVAIAQLA